MSLNNEHAARLRDMADQNQLNASVWREQSTSLSPWSGLTHRQCHQEGLRCEREAAALLAGAEALERQERDLAAIKAADAALTEAMETISDLRGSLEAAKAALLREAAELMRERGTLLTERDWKTMYEAQERDMAALRKEREEAMGLLGKFIDEARGEK